MKPCPICHRKIDPTRQDVVYLGKGTYRHASHRLSTMIRAYEELRAEKEKESR
jgi:hypothetical protein